MRATTTIRRVLCAPLLLTLALSACGGDKAGPTAPSDLRARLQRALDSRVGRDGVRSALLLVDSPDHGLRFEGAAGLADPTTGRTAHPNDRFRTASVTKVFTAALVLALAEEGRLELDEPLARYLPAERLARVHVLAGRHYGPDLTARQLLSHTSGLGDFRDVDTDRDGLPDFAELLLAQPARRWQPLELVAWAAEHAPPRFAPGAGFHYADPNYHLLGLLAEAAAARPLEQALRERLLDPLGLADTWLESYQAPRAGAPPSHAFEGDLDTAHVDASWEWAAGGLASTTSDLARFARALFEGGLLRPESLAAMREPSAASGGRYGLGLSRENVPGAELIGHNGYWGVVFYYWPARRAVICGTLNQGHADTAALLRDVVQALE